MQLLYDHSPAAYHQVCQTIHSPETGLRMSHIANVSKHLAKEKEVVSGAR